MTNRKNTFLIKRSNVPGKVPTPGDLQLGELALNTADVILYASGTTANQILPIGWDRLSTLSGGTVNGDVTINGFVSATTYYNLPTFSGEYLPLSGGTVYGNTIFTSGLTASTLTVEGLTQTSGITSTGGIIFPQKTINSTYTAQTEDYSIDASGGTFTIYLPTAVGVQGKLYNIKNNGGGAVTVQPFGSETIDDKPFVILGETNALQLVSNGTNWVALGYNISTVNSSTGVFEFTGLTKISATTFSVSSVRGWIVDDTTNPLSPQIYYIDYSGGTHTDNYVNTDFETYVYLTSSGTIGQQPTPLTEQQRRQNIFLGKLGHPDKTAINLVFSQPDFVLSPLAQLRDMFVPINLINGGVVPSTNGANLKFNTNAGYIYGLGINFTNDTLAPNALYIPGTNPCTFQYRTQTGGTVTNVTDIDPLNYDVGGVKTPITGTKATNQRIYLLQNGSIRVMYGQEVYNTLALAIEALQTESFTPFPNFVNNAVLIGILTVLSTATDLTDTSKARFFFASKFGETVGAAGGTSTTNLQQAYNNSSTPEITTNVLQDGVQIRGGTGNDNDKNIIIESNSGTQTAWITASGDSRFHSVSSNTISDVTRLSFNNSHTGTTAPGQLTWNTSEGTLNLGMLGGNVTQQIGLEQYYQVINNVVSSGITNGSVVAAYGIDNITDKINGGYMIANGTLPYYVTLGVATEDILSGNTGYVNNFGIVRDIDTTGTPYGETWLQGDILYVSPTIPGGLTNVIPNTPNLKIQIALVLKLGTTDGTLFVRPSLGYNLNDLHNVKNSGSESNGDLLIYSASTSSWVYGSTLPGNYVVGGTLSASTFYGDGSNLTNIPDNFVTGGTYSSGTLTLNRQNGSVSITGFTTGGGVDTYWVSGSTGTNSIKAINSTGLDATGDRSLAWGNQTLASGNDSTAWGFGTSATTVGSTASGYQTVAQAQYSHSEGLYTTSSGQYSHSEGRGSVANANGSHAEGYYTTSSGQYSHSEGYQTVSLGNYSHSEGRLTTASGYYSHAEGRLTTSSGNDSHAEGYQTTALGIASHSEGYQTTASGNYSHSEGKSTTASGNYSHAEGRETTADGPSSHAEGRQTTASGYASHSEGNLTVSIGDQSHAEGKQTTASGKYSHSEGYATTSSSDYSHTEGQQTTTIGLYSHSEGKQTTAQGNSSHSEGNSTTASSNYSHSEGGYTTSIGQGSHAEGIYTTASGVYSHAEGYLTTALGNYSHAQGSGTTATGQASFASGMKSRAVSDGSFIHSMNSVVNGQRSVVLGGQNITGSTDDTVYVPNFNINTTPTTNNSLTNFLVRDTNGDISVRNYNSINYIPNLVTVALTGGSAQFTSIKSAVDSITGASATNPYVVMVGPGVFIEDTITMKSYVDVVGQSATNTIIQANDPNSTLIIGADQSMVNNVQIQGCTGTSVAAVVYSSSTTPQLNAIFYVENVRFGSNYTHVKNVGTGGGNSIIQCSNVKYGGYPFTLGFYCTNDGSGIGRMQLRNVTSTNGGVVTATGLTFAKADKSGCGFIVNGCLLTKAVGAAAGTGFWVEDGGFLRLTGVNFQRWSTGIYAPQVGSAPSIDAIALNFENCTTDVNIIHSGATGKIQGTDNFLKTQININAPIYEVNTDPREIIVAKKGGDFSSIKSAVDYLVASATTSETSRYVISVGPGLFIEPEIDLTNTPYVSIVGSNIQTTQIVPSTNTQHIIKIGVNNEISFLSLSGAPSGYAGIYCYDIGDFGQAHKLSFYDCDTNIWVESDTQDTKFYGEYLDFNGEFTYGTKVIGNNGYLALANMENYYNFPTGSNVTYCNYATGSGATLSVFVGDNVSNGVSGSTGFYIQDGAELNASTITCDGFTYGILNPNIGDPIRFDVDNASIVNGEWDLYVERAGTFGTFGGSSSDEKIFTNSTDIYWLFLDIDDGELDITRKASITFADGTHTDFTTLLFEGATMGLIDGGHISEVSGLTINVDAGFGYLYKSATPEVHVRVDWLSANTVLTSGSSLYIYYNENSVLSTSGSKPSSTTNIILGRVVTDETSIRFIDSSPVFAQHTSNKFDSLFSDAMGPIYATGSIVTEGTTPFTIDVTQGDYHYSTNKYLPVGGSGLTFTQYYRDGLGNWITTATTIVNSTSYDGNGVLSALTTSYYTKHTLYLVGDDTNEQYMLVLGQNEYSTLVQAENALLATPPSFFSDSVVQIANIYVQQGATGFTEVEDIRPTIAFRAGGVNASSVHGNLLGLGADDHIQYLLVNGGRAMSGNLDMGSNDITNVGLVDGVTVSAHATRHQFGGADPVGSVTPSANAIPYADVNGLLDSWISTATTTTLGKVTLSTAPTSASNPIVVSVTDPGYKKAITGFTYGSNVLTGTSVDGSVTTTTIGLRTKAGTVAGASFAGNPKKFTVTFTTAYPNTNYSIQITGGINRTFTYESKSTTGFVINSNANTAFVENVDWVTIANGES